MKHTPKKVFILEGNNYKEITYEELCRLTESENALYADKHFLPLHGMLMEVSIWILKCCGAKTMITLNFCFSKLSCATIIFGK